MRAVIFGLAAALVATAVQAQPAPDAARDAVKAQIWGMEQAIFDGRSRGDLKPYQSGLADGYLAWPPFRAAPAGPDGLNKTAQEMKGTSGERLTMTFMDIAVNGDTAIIYYKTHRTALADGTPVDETWETTHTWVRQAGQWKVLGGMARIAPKRP